MDRSGRKERLEAHCEALPANDQTTILLLEPSTGPLRLEPRDNLPDRPASDLREGRTARPDPPHHIAHIAGCCPRRRIWRCRDLRCRACAQQQALCVDGLDPIVGVVRIVGSAAGDRGHAHLPGRGCVQRLGLAHPLPCVLGTAGDLAMDARQAFREPGIRSTA